MTNALLAGLVAGLSVAVFVGAASMTVMETAIQRGLKLAIAGGAGIASGDGLWTAVAAGAGVVVRRLLSPWAPVLQWIAVGTFVVILVLAMGEVLGRDAPASVVGLADSPLRAYGEFLGHAVRDPTTVGFFMSLILGAAPRYGATEAAAFVGGVFLASLTWQWLLAFAGARRGRLFSSRTRRIVLALDCLLLALFIAEVALGSYGAG